MQSPRTDTNKGEGKTNTQEVLNRPGVEWRITHYIISDFSFLRCDIRHTLYDNRGFTKNVV